ncbi:MAG: branched-chain amino acid ABC transporter permease [Nitrososphaerota archaeon]
MFIFDVTALLAVYLIITISLNTEYGYAGIPHFGKVLAVAGGAFLAGFLPGRLGLLLLKILPIAGEVRIDCGVAAGRFITSLDQALELYISCNAGVVDWLSGVLAANIGFALTLTFITLVVSGLAGAFLGFISSYPGIRLRGDYLAMVLLAMGELLRIVGYNYEPLVGGTLGVSVPNLYAWAGGEMRFVAATVFIVLVAAGVYLYAELLARSPLGRLLRAMRDNEITAEALGKDVAGLRMRTLVVGSAISSLAGTLYALYAGGVIATTYSRVSWTFWPWVMVILGGTANNVGTLAGTSAFVIFRQLIIFYKDRLASFVPFNVVWLDTLILGAVLIVILLYRPQGIIPEKPTLTIRHGRLLNIIQSGGSRRLEQHEKS